MTASTSVPPPPAPGRFPLVDVLEAEITAAAHSLHPQVYQMVQVFLKYLREPRFQAPLTMPQLSQLFASWNRDLASVVIGLYTSSNSLKKSLIAQSEYINAHPKVFDYLLAIANYSASSIKLLKRHDADALYQLRVFNFYKFYTVWAQIRQAQQLLYTSVLGDAVTPSTRVKRTLKDQRDDTSSIQGDDDTLYAKVLRFDQRDIIHQEFFDEKIALLRQYDLPWTAFVHSESPDQHDKLDKFFAELTADDVAALQAQLTAMAAAKTPHTKLLAVVGLNRQLVELLRHHGFANAEINNDILLPVLIYLVVTRLDPQDLVLNFHFIKNLGYQLDPYRIELYSVPGVSSSLTSYQPQDKVNKSQLHKHRLQNLFELLNMHPEVDADTPEPAMVAVDSEFEFCPTTAALISFITDNYLNNGELMYYLTNLEALVMFLSNVTIDELSSQPPVSESPLMVHPISKLVEDDMMSHFAFPKGTLAEEELANGTSSPKKSPKSSPNRSRSSSLMQSITNRIGDATTRILNENGTSSRQNSNANRESSGFSELAPRDSPTKESFPSLTNDGDSGVLSVSSENLNQEDSSSFSMMRSFLGRLNSVSQFSLAQDGSVGTRLSPSHSRTRSSSYEPNGKRNTITKFASGMSEFMTKFNNPVHPSNDDVADISGSEGLDSSLTTIRPQPTRARTNSSFQVMDKWLQNLAAPASPLKTHEPPTRPSVNELTRFRGADFESLSIADLKTMKRYYDFMCSDLAVDESAEDLEV